MTTKPPLPELKPSGNNHGNPLERRRGFLAGMGGDGLPVIGWNGRTRFRVSPWIGSTLFRWALVNKATICWVSVVTVEPVSRLSPSTGSRLPLVFFGHLSSLMEWNTVFPVHSWNEALEGSVSDDSDRVASAAPVTLFLRRMRRWRAPQPTTTTLWPLTPATIRKGECYADQIS